MSKKGSKNKKYSPEFKLSVIMDMRNNNLTYSKVCQEKATVWTTVVWKTSLED